MEQYLSKWIQIIEEMKNDNTYKPAWGRAIIECVHLEEYSVKDNIVTMKQSDIANKMMKYYWNQTFFFGLNQGRNPVILQKVKQMMRRYKTEVSTYPKPWNEVEKYFLDQPKYYEKIISSILSNARTNVCPRFKNVSGGETLEIYHIDDANKLLYFSLQDIKILDEYKFVLSKLLNFKWAQLLERFNTAPNITKKVNAATDRKIKRQSLSKYKHLLLEYFKDKDVRDFYTGELLDKSDIHIDHVIPWSFVYSDDIWNLVVTKSTTNLQKNNRPPTKEEIQKLKDRNKKLYLEFQQTHPNISKQIEYALNNKLIDKLYINMRG